MMELQKAKVIAEELKSLVDAAGCCERMTIAGSIRRQKPEVGDVELLCIPRFVDGVDQLDKELGALCLQRVLDFRRNKRGSIVYGPKNKLMVHLPSGIGVDIFSTDERCWWVALVIRTGPKESNIAIARAAQRRGWRLRAYGSGFDTPDGRIECRAERAVFEVVGLPYQPPERR